MSRVKGNEFMTVGSGVVGSFSPVFKSYTDYRPKVYKYFLPNKHRF